MVSEKIFSSPEQSSRWAFGIVWCPSSVVRLALCSVNFFLLKASPLKLLEGFQPNYTGMILGWSPLKIVQMVLVCWLIRSQELKIDFFFLNLLLWNHKAQSFDIWYVASPNGALPSLFKLWPLGPKWPRSRAYQFFIVKSLKIFFSETVRPRALIFGMLHHQMELNQVCSNYDPRVQNGPTLGLISFS